MSFIINPYRFAASLLWAFHASANANNANISGPASGVQVGDLAVLFDAAHNASATIPTLVVPSGYTQINSVTATNGVTISSRSTISYKILTAGDITAGAMNSVTGQSGGGTSYKIMSVFRNSNGPLSSVTINSVQGEGTVNAPANQTIPLNGVVLPALALAHYRTQTTPGFTGTGMTDMLGNNTVHLAKYRLFNSGQADQVVSMTDGGAFNSLQSFYVTGT